MTRLLSARYVPPHLPPSLLATLNLVLALLAITRGSDWLDIGDPSAFSAVLLALDVPIRVWGGLLTAGGLVLVVGILARRHLAVWLGHLLLAVTYIGLTVTVADVVVNRAGSGYYQLVPFIGGAIWHVVMVDRTRLRSAP